MFAFDEVIASFATVSVELDNQVGVWGRSASVRIPACELQVELAFGWRATGNDITPTDRAR